MYLSSWARTDLRTISIILVLLVAFIIAVWNSTEIAAPVYHVKFTTNMKEITLSPFPYDVSGVAMSVPTSEDSCYWIVNNTQHHHYIFNDTYILLQPFGKNFTNTTVTCSILETGKIYSLLIGDICPCKYQSVRPQW